jgi:sugar O-acyltransferase (sialic acid O-acetyltransferase NeuD family)
MKKIAMFGAGGHAKVITDIIKNGGEYEITGVFDDSSAEAEFSSMAEHFDGAVVAVGDNWLRHQIVHRIHQIAPALPFVTFIHPAATVASDVIIGAGTVVMAGAVINSGTSIAEHCIINTRAVVDHDCHIASFASVAPGATLGGTVRIGSFAAIGLGSSVIHRMVIGEHTVVGAGSTVVKPLGAYLVAYGSPAKQIRTRSAGERYL